MNNITWAYSCTSTYTRQYPLKVSSMRPILSVFLCALFCSVLVFFTPPVAMYHHLPLSVGASVICRQSWEKNQGQKCVLGGSTVRQKSIFIYFRVTKDTFLLHFQASHFVVYLLCARAVFYNPLGDLMYILVYMCMLVYIAATCFLHICKLWYDHVCNVNTTAHYLGVN